MSKLAVNMLLDQLHAGERTEKEARCNQELTTGQSIQN